VDIPTDPGNAGEFYDVDLSPYDIITNKEMMVLLYDGYPDTGLILPAGDSSQSCFNGSDYCSLVLLPEASSLFLYATNDAEACPTAEENIRLYDVVVEVDYLLDEATDVPSRAEGFALQDAQPNPFNPRTVIEYKLPHASAVRLEVFDLAGRSIRNLIDSEIAEGTHQVHWDGRNQEGHPVASGVYLYRLLTPEFQESKRMVLLK
jgi:hypothetical protein